MKRTTLTAIKPDKAAIEIGELYQKARLSLVESVRHAIECGKRLIAKKDSLNHGEWLPWLRDNADVLGFDTPKTAQRLIALAANTTPASSLDEVSALAASRHLWGHGNGRRQPANPVALSLLEFIADRGGLKPHSELNALGFTGTDRVQIPGRKGFFAVTRPKGMDLDRMREAVEEAGYLIGEHNNTSTVRDLLDAIANELRGNRKYAEGEEGTRTNRELAHVAGRERAVWDRIGESPFECIVRLLPKLTDEERERVHEMTRPGRDDDQSASTKRRRCGPAECFSETFVPESSDAENESSKADQVVEPGEPYPHARASA